MACVEGLSEGNGCLNYGKLLVGFPFLHACSGDLTYIVIAGNISYLCRPQGHNITVSI